MSEFLREIDVFFISHINISEIGNFFLFFFPFILFIELPYYLLVLLSTLRFSLGEVFTRRQHLPYYPSVTCIVTCYNEGSAIIHTLRSLQEQLYRGKLEVLLIIDGAKQNQATLNIAQQFLTRHPPRKHQQFNIIPKWTRGGHASSMNLGLKLATGELIISLDGDCSCDNDMVAMAVTSFIESGVVGISGSLRVRNARKNLLTRVQSLEYMLGIHLSRIGLGSLNLLNNAASAFSVFRKDFLIRMGGWKNGSAEDLDLTLRIQSNFKRHSNLKLRHNPHAIVHTDVPETWRQLLKQRLRWDGDIYYIYCFRHWRLLRPKFLGWKGFFGLMWSGLLIHIVLPFVLLSGVIYLLLAYSLAYAGALLLVTYAYYMVITLLLFIVYWLLVSERKAYDASFLLFLPLLPLYQLIMRTWSACAITIEILIKSHKDSSMGPWWVNRKVR